MMIASLPLSRRETPTAGPLTTTTSKSTSTSGNNEPVHTAATPLATPRRATVATELPCHDSPPTLSTTTVSPVNSPHLVSTANEAK
jgi:hypothetical protein